jgi:hypothetical protein
MHWVKSQSFVCWSEMELLREMMHFFLTEMHLVKNSLAKCSGTDGVSKEAESVGEFDWDSRCSYVSRIGSCIECSYCVSNR